MRRWDRLLDSYMEQYSARGTCAERVRSTRATLEPWGGWMKQRRPRVVLERVDADLLVRYIESRTSFRAKSTVYGTLSTMRGMGEFLVREGIWQVNPLRWMKGPKVTPYHRLPRRIDRQAWCTPSHAFSREAHLAQGCLPDRHNGCRTRIFVPASQHERCATRLRLT